MLGTLLGVGLGTWLAGLGAAVAAQRRLIFKPPVRVRRLAPGPHLGRYRVETLSCEVSPGVRLQGWRSLPREGEPLGTLLYFGGRGEHVAWAAHMSSWLPGWSVVAFHHRGFGLSDGRAGERELQSDALQLHAAWVPAGQPCVLMGRSLGTAVAVHVAARVAPQALVLMSPFESLVALARARWWLAPAAGLLRHRLETRDAARRVACPTLVLVAPGDREVPPAHSRRLAARLGGPVRWVEVPGQHHRSLPRSVRAQLAVAAFVRENISVRGAPAPAGWPAAAPCRRT